MNSANFADGATAMIHLLAYANPRTLALDSARQAQSVIASLEHKSGNWIELDFSGVDSVSEEFADELFGFADREMAAGIWLVPTHYNEQIRPYLNRQLSLLQHRRDQVWSSASLATEFGPGC